ncbi:MAG: GNAT family N-acetyltransferase [Dehalococcoidales bacterium]|nr:GNAT family N-acetyltransferase [Dehalococcoidales bacterium]
MLDSRNNLAMIWDIRIHTDYRRNGTGTLLFHHVAQLSKLQGCSQLKIET